MHWMLCFYHLRFIKMQPSLADNALCSSLSQNHIETLKKYQDMMKAGYK